VTGTAGTASGPFSLAKDTPTATFTASLISAGGQVIDGVTFVWTVVGGNGGNGSISQNASGSQCNFNNVLWVRGKKKYDTGLTCVVQAEAYFLGTAVSGTSGLITLL